MILARSAPENPGVIAAITSRSASEPRVTCFGMDAQDGQAANLIRTIDQHLAIEPTGPQQCGIQDFRPIGRPPSE